jgi:hypothetical protein
LKHSIWIVSFLSLSVQATVVAPKNVNPEINDVFTEKAMPKAEIAEKHDIYPFEAQASYLYGQGRFKQSGDGQQYDTEAGSGQGIQLEFIKKYDDYVLKIMARHQNINFVEPESIGGSDVAVTRQHLSITHGRTVASHLVLEFGAALQIQSSDSFTGNEKLVAQYTSLGPKAAVEKQTSINETWSWHNGIAAVLPLMFRESGSNSGSHTYGLQGEAHSIFKARLNRQLNITVGVRLEGERHVFSGESEREISDATLNYVAIVLPIGVSYEF